MIPVSTFRELADMVDKAMGVETFGGFQLNRDPNLVEQFRFPKSKKKRIRNKWSKRAVNFRPMTNALVIKAANIIFVHPQFYDQLRKRLLDGVTDKEPS